MSDCRFLVNDIIIDRNKLRLDCAAVYPADSLIPKVRVLFRRGGEIRRLPLLCKATFDRSRTGDKTSIYSYIYFIDKLFLKETDEEISVSFEIETGDECDSEVAFFISASVASKSQKEIAPEYLGGNLFDGVAVYSNEESEEEILEDVDKVYECHAEPESRRLVITQRSISQKSGKCRQFLTALALACTFIFFAFGIIFLFPLFIVDALFATLNLSPRRRALPKESFAGIFIGQFKANMASFIKYAFKNQPISIWLITYKDYRFTGYYNRLCKKPVVENRVAFISGRRDEIGGNEKFVYDLLKDRDDIDFRFLMVPDLDRYSSPKDIKEFYYLYATSKVVIVDDYYAMLNTVEKRDDVTLFQFWHACGAFKTFGFTRLGKEGGPKQASPNHRMYDRALVSSESIVKYYAEGFGISDDKVLPTGIPRTDVFADKEYGEKIRENFFSRYPDFKGKKIILFAPTFRGAGQKSAFYPLSVFSPEKFMDELGDDYRMIIKLHPFCTERFEINEKAPGRIIDLSEEDELNDLLFVTDLLITDYSSAVFEASLLNIPMVFYAYDLYQYISERDFYCDYESFVPGRIVFTQDEMEKAIKSGELGQEKIPAFRDKFFTSLDGKSSERVAKEILKALGKE